MTIASGGRPPKINAKRAFELYIEYGSLKAGLEAYNNEAGEVVTPWIPSFSKAIHNYIIWNQEETRPILLEGPRKNGKFKDDFVWYSLMVDYAFQVFLNSPKGFLRWFMSDQNETLRQKYPILVHARYQAKYGRPLEVVQE